MKSINSSDSDKITIDSTAYKIAHHTVRIGGIALAVSTVLYPLDVLLHSMHTKNDPKMPIGSRWRTILTAASWNSAKHFISGYPAALKVAGTKNAVMTNSKAVKETIEGKSEFMHSEHDAESPRVKNSMSNAGMMQLMAVPFAMASIDIFFTQYTVVKKTLKIQQVTNPAFNVPQPTTPTHLLRTFSAGIAPRLLKSTATIGAYLVIPSIAKKLDKVFPENTQLNLGMAASTIVTGATISGLTNACIILFKNQVIQMDHDFRVPTLRQTAKKIWEQKGARGFVKGYGLTAIYTTIAFSMVNKAEKVMDNIVLPKMSEMVDQLVKGTKKRDQKLATPTQKDNNMSAKLVIGSFSLFSPKHGYTIKSYPKTTPSKAADVNLPPAQEDRHSCKTSSS